MNESSGRSEKAGVPCSAWIQRRMSRCCENPPPALGSAAAAGDSTIPGAPVRTPPSSAPRARGARAPPRGPRTSWARASAVISTALSSSPVLASARSISLGSTSTCLSSGLTLKSGCPSAPRSRRRLEEDLLDGPRERRPHRVEHLHHLDDVERWLFSSVSPRRRRAVGRAPPAVHCMPPHIATISSARSPAAAPRPSSCAAGDPGR